MTNNNKPGSQSVDRRRRRILSAVGAGALSSALGGVFGGSSNWARAQKSQQLRWGVVGTGSIANRVAPMIQLADNAELVAVSSRRMDTAQQFAETHKLDNAFDSWAEMAAWNGIDAIYVATPTSVREEICVTTAENGKHVLGEKPFANLPSLQRITGACLDNSVGFMDGTHFVHHPRTALIKSITAEKLSWPWSVDSAFQFSLSDISNIRMRPELEPYGAIGDAGWYNMRAAVEFLTPDVNLSSTCTYLRRHKKTNAVISGSGVITFDDESTTTWNCGFESGALIMDLRISTAGGIIKLDDFVLNQPQQPARFYLIDAAFGSGDSEKIEVPTSKPAAALMFENFAAMIGNTGLLEASIRASQRTQELLDAVWESGAKNGRS